MRVMRAAMWVVPVPSTELQQPRWERGIAATEEGRKCTCPLVLALASGTGMCASRIVDISRVRTRGQLRRVRVCKDIAARCECGAVYACTARATTVDVDTAQTVGEDDGKPGSTRTHATSLTSAVRSYPCPCPAAAAVWEVLVREVRGARTDGGAVSWIGDFRACTILAGCFPHWQVLKLREYGSTDVDG